MQIEDYPPQEPLSEAGKKYAEEAMRLGRGIAGEDHVFGEDPYQCFAVYVPDEGIGTVLAFVHGGDDFPHLITQATAMEASLGKAGGAVSRIVFEDHHHYTVSHAGGEADEP